MKLYEKFYEKREIHFNINYITNIDNNFVQNEIPGANPTILEFTTTTPAL
jgi:hypothetical protein